MQEDYILKTYSIENTINAVLTNGDEKKMKKNSNNANNKIKLDEEIQPIAVESNKYEQSTQLFLRSTIKSKKSMYLII